MVGVYTRTSLTTAKSSKIMICLCVVDVLHCCIEKKYRNVKHQDLRHLVDTLPLTLMKSKAKSTTDTYLRGLGIWKEWITNFKEIEFLPANSLHVALCIQSYTV